MGALFTESDNISRETLKVGISLIEPAKNQPRKEFREESLDELADSIKKYGVLQPLIVEKDGIGYRLIAGERRWRAAKKAGLTEVPVIIKELKSGEAAEIALIENLQRVDLNPVEEAMAYRSLTEEYGLKQDEIAEKVSKSRAAVANSLRLLKLPDEILVKVADGTLSAGHARAILSVPDEEKRKELAEKCGSQGLSVRDCEKLAKKLSETPEQAPAETETATKEPDDEAGVYLRAAETQLSQSLGTKVQIKPGTNGRGKIVLSYYSPEDLNGIIERLR